MGVGDKIWDTMRAAVLLQSRVQATGDAVSELAKEVRLIDKRLVRVETLIELSSRRGPPPTSAPPALEDQR